MVNDVFKICYRDNLSSYAGKKPIRDSQIYGKIYQMKRMWYPEQACIFVKNNGIN